MFIMEREDFIDSALEQECNLFIVFFFHSLYIFMHRCKSTHFGDYLYRVQRFITIILIMH